MHIRILFYLFAFLVIVVVPFIVLPDAQFRDIVKKSFKRDTFRCGKTFVMVTNLGGEGSPDAGIVTIRKSDISTILEDRIITEIAGTVWVVHISEDTHKQVLECID